MDERAKSLWRRVREALKGKGWVFAEGLTPEQVGLLVQQIARDDRVLRFVREYYYPKGYGGVATGLGDPAAEEIVRGLESRAPRAQAARVLTMEDVNCSLCGDKVEGNEPPKG